MFKLELVYTLYICFKDWNEIKQIMLKHQCESLRFCVFGFVFFLTENKSPYLDICQYSMKRKQTLWKRMALRWSSTTQNYCVPWLSHTSPWKWDFRLNSQAAANYIRVDSQRSYSITVTITSLREFIYSLFLSWLH